MAIHLAFILLPNTRFKYSHFNISGNNVVWSGFDGSDYEIYLNNGISTIQMTNNSFKDSRAEIYGNNVVWQS